MIFASARRSAAFRTLNPTSTTYLNNPNYSNFLLDHFNTVTQGNAGKWAYNEGTRDVVTMSAVDRIFQFAQDNDLERAAAQYALGR